MEKSKKHWWIPLIVIFALVTVAFATSTIWNEMSNKTAFVKDKYIVVDLSGVESKATMRPGSTAALAPVLTNNGDIQATAMMRLQLPVVNGSSAYDFTVNSAWTELEDESEPERGIFIYGYGSGSELLEIAPGESTSSLVSDGFTLKSEITGKQFNAMPNIDIEVTGYMADATEDGFGTVPDDVWRVVGE